MKYDMTSRGYGIAGIECMCVSARVRVCMCVCVCVTRGSMREFINPKPSYNKGIIIERKITLSGYPGSDSRNIHNTDSRINKQ